MAQSTNVFLDSTASLATTYISEATIYYKNLQLPFTNSTLGRVVYIKEAGEYPGPSVLSVAPSTGTTVQGSTIVYLNSNQALMLQAVSSTYWAILGAYQGTSSFSAQATPVNSVVVNPTMNVTNIFVDLRTQSKTVVLPPIQTLVTNPAQVPFYTIKDVYGNAQVSTFYISTSGNDTLENSTIRNAILIPDNYGSIDIVADLAHHKWHILNYYNGIFV